MKFAAKIFLSVVAWVLLVGLMVVSVKAATPGYTACGAQATGVDKSVRDKANPNGKVVSGAFARQFVGPDGVWHTCQPWVPDGGDPAMPEPAPTVFCEGRDTYETWEADGLTCTSIPPGYSNSTTLKLRKTPAGRAALIYNPWGNPAGMAVYRCAKLPNGAAEWKLEGATCAYR